MRRVSVVGTSGSGKSTLAARLAAHLAVPHVELDALRHQAGWQPLPDPAFRARVTELVAGDSWVVDGNYPQVLDLVWARVDTVVWLDLPRPTTTARLVRRTARRWVRGEELWNGNRERLRDVLALHDPQRSVLAWSVTSHAAVRARYEASLVLDPPGDVEVVRLRSPTEVRRWTGRLRTT